MKSFFLLLLVAMQLATGAQVLQPGFDRDEYISLMKVSSQFGDSAYAAALPPPMGFQRLYRSPVTGLDNRWELWKTDKGAGIISIRGTTAKEVSWLANFYAAMVPAQGTLQLSKENAVPYKLADDQRAAVHIGWLISTCSMSPHILRRIDSCYKQGMRSFYIMGHSQGGSIAFLLTALLRQMQKDGALPSDLRLKTYCSAAPKPGNLYFAYSYEAMTQGGWACNVVNAADWVPQSPFSVQTVDDFVPINPFSNARPVIQKQGWPKKWVLNYAYGKLSRPAKRTMRKYRKYLGGFVAKAVKKNLKGYREPAYAHTADYSRTGTTIVLTPGKNYFEKFPQDPSKIFINHLHGPYLFLAAQLGERGEEK